MLNMHEEFLFEHLLNHDFLEGKVLNYVAKRDNLSRKKLFCISQTMEFARAGI